MIGLKKNNLIKKDFSQMNPVSVEEDSFNNMNDTLRTQPDEEGRDDFRERSIKGCQISNRKGQIRQIFHKQDNPLKQVEYEETELVIEEDEASFLRMGENKYKFTFSESEYVDERLRSNCHNSSMNHQTENINSPGNLGPSPRYYNHVNRCSVFESGQIQQYSVEDDSCGQLSKIYEQCDENHLKPFELRQSEVDEINQVRGFYKDAYETIHKLEALDDNNKVKDANEGIKSNEQQELSLQSKSMNNEDRKESITVLRASQCDISLSGSENHSKDDTRNILDSKLIHLEDKTDNFVASTKIMGRKDGQSLVSLTVVTEENTSYQSHFNAEEIRKSGILIEDSCQKNTSGQYNNISTAAINNSKEIEGFGEKSTVPKEHICLVEGSPYLPQATIATPIADRKIQQATPLNNTNEKSNKSSPNSEARLRKNMFMPRQMENLMSSVDKNNRLKNSNLESPLHSNEGNNSNGNTLIGNNVKSSLCLNPQASSLIINSQINSKERMQILPIIPYDINNGDPKMKRHIMNLEGDFINIIRAPPSHSLNNSAIETCLSESQGEKKILNIEKECPRNNLRTVYDKGNNHKADMISKNLNTDEEVAPVCHMENPIGTQSHLAAPAREPCNFVLSPKWGESLNIEKPSYEICNRIFSKPFSFNYGESRGMNSSHDGNSISIKQNESLGQIAKSAETSTRNDESQILEKISGQEICPDKVLERKIVDKIDKINEKEPPIVQENEFVPLDVKKNLARLFSFKETGLQQTPKHILESDKRELRIENKTPLFENSEGKKTFASAEKFYSMISDLHQQIVDKNLMEKIDKALSVISKNDNQIQPPSQRTSIQADPIASVANKPMAERLGISHETQKPEPSQTRNLVENLSVRISQKIEEGRKSINAHDKIREPEMVQSSVKLMPVLNFNEIEYTSNIFRSVLSSLSNQPDPYANMVNHNHTASTRTLQSKPADQYTDWENLLGTQREAKSHFQEITTHRNSSDVLMSTRASENPGKLNLNLPVSTNNNPNKGNHRNFGSIDLSCTRDDQWLNHSSNNPNGSFILHNPSIIPTAANCSFKSVSSHFSKNGADSLNKSSDVCIGSQESNPLVPILSHRMDNISQKLNELESISKLASLEPEQLNKNNLVFNFDWKATEADNIKPKNSLKNVSEKSEPEQMAQKKADEFLSSIQNLIDETINKHKQDVLRSRSSAPQPLRNTYERAKSSETDKKEARPSIETVQSLFPTNTVQFKPIIDTKSAQFYQKEQQSLLNEFDNKLMPSTTTNVSGTATSIFKPTKWILDLQNNFPRGNKSAIELEKKDFLKRLQNDLKRRMIKQSENERLKKQKEIEEARQIREQHNVKSCSAKDNARVVNKMMTDAQRRKADKERKIKEKEQEEMKKALALANTRYCNPKSIQLIEKQKRGSEAMSPSSSMNTTNMKNNYAENNVMKPGNTYRGSKPEFHISNISEPDSIPCKSVYNKIINPNNSKAKGSSATSISYKENQKPRAGFQGNSTQVFSNKKGESVFKMINNGAKNSYDKLHNQMNVLEDCGKIDQSARFLTLAHPEIAYDSCLFDYEDEQYEIIKDEGKGWRMSSKKSALESRISKELNFQENVCINTFDEKEHFGDRALADLKGKYDNFNNQISCYSNLNFPTPKDKSKVFKFI